MRLYALLQNDVVASVQECEEEQVVDLNKNYLVVDVTDYLVSPSQGWILSGNKIIPDSTQTVSVKDMVKAKLKQYRSKTSELLIDLYATNTLSGMTSNESDALFELYQDVIFCLNEGAMPTAIYRINKKVDNGDISREVADEWIAKIQAVMV